MTLKSNSELVSKLANEYLERRRRGEKPDVAEYAERYPEFAAEIRDVFPMLQIIEEDAAEKELSGQLQDLKLERLGDFVIEREIGRGGMGVVYEAMQESLNRQVALKVCPLTTGMSETHRERFRRESRAAAKLHHTNIVPIFGVGEQQSLMYFAMQLIDGVSLVELIEDIRQIQASVPESSDSLGKSSAKILGSSSGSSPNPYWKNIAQLMVQVAGALEHAHSHGVNHRDIKPGNIMLDEAGHIWILDFGLSKSTSEADLTTDGELVGTLRYMAPEQMNGKADSRADLYSLGLVLYELLTLVPAFPQEHRGELLEAISNQQPQRPRSVERRIPRDLETIVLKLIEKNPQHRYGSADELTQDLNSFIRGEPIRARRANPIERMAKWSRRQPVIASLCAALLLTLTLSLSLVTWKWRDEVKARETAVQKQTEANAATKAETEAKALAESRLRQAQEIVREYLVEISKSRGLLAQNPGTQELRNNLLEKARDYYVEFLRDSKQDLALKFDAAKANFELAEILNQLTAYSDLAIEEYANTVATLKSLEGEASSTDDLEMLRLFQRASGSLATAYMMRGRNDEAEAEFQQALEVSDQVLALDHNPDTVLDRCVTLHNLAMLFDRQRAKSDENRVKADELYTQAVEVARPLLVDQMDNPRFLRQVGNMLVNLGYRRIAGKSKSERIKLMREGLELKRQALALEPDNPEQQWHVAISLNDLGLLLYGAGHREEAVQDFKESDSIHQRLTLDSPRVAKYLLSHSRTYNNLATCFGKQGDYATSAGYLRKVADLSTQLIELDPDNPTFVVRQVNALTLLADSQMLLGQLELAAESWQQATDSYWKLSQEHPSNTGYAIQLVELLGACEEPDRLRLEAALQRLVGKEKFSDESLCFMSYGLALTGDRDAARLQLEQCQTKLESTQPQNYEELEVTQALVAMACMEPGQRDGNAAANLEAIRDRIVGSIEFGYFNQRLLRRLETHLVP